MAGATELKADPRSTAGKQIAKRLRREGLIPAVMYRHATSLPCTVNLKDFETLVHEEGRNAIISLQVNGDGEHTTIIKEIQHHPVRGSILHVDFHEISLTDKVVVEIPIHIVGSPVGVRQEGGILEHRLHRLEVECLPMQIPEHIEVDVSEMAIGDTIHVSDLTLEGDVTIVADPQRSVFVVVPPSVFKTADEEAEEGEEGEIGEEELTEPELVERGKKEDGDDDSSE